MVLIYKKGQKEDPGKHRPVSLTLLLEKVMEQTILSAITWYTQENQENHWLLTVSYAAPCMLTPLFPLDNKGVINQSLYSTAIHPHHL